MSKPSPTMKTRMGQPHHPGVDETDKRDEQTDADGDGGTQSLRHSLKHGGAETGEHEDRDQDALPDHESHSLRPGHFRGEGVGDQRVQAEAGSKPHGETSDHAHEDGHDARYEGGGGCHHPDGGADCGGINHGSGTSRAFQELGGPGDQVAVDVGGGANDERVQRDDVCHREECHQATAHLLPDRRAMFGDTEITLGPGGASESTETLRSPGGFRGFHDHVSGS